MNLEGISEFDRTHFILHPSNKALVEEFEKKLAGKSGELVVLFYTTARGNFFRFGRLEGVELAWDEQTLITLPIGEFVTGAEGCWKEQMAHLSTYKANIFSQRVEGLDHFPTLLCNYIVGEEKTDPRVYPRPSSLEVFIGNDEADNYFTAHEGMSLKPSPWLKDLLKNGPGPDFLKDADPPPSAAWDELCEVHEP